ncbi:uncharacterized protein LOC141907448 [Tubulanus polymorphus]|uniref:uncharacterized protein LOC141907448 n=1 Tax=Tubulanus polymorphus TaxID=672921 RepID=UPI003DA5FC98
MANLSSIFVTLGVIIISTGIVVLIVCWIRHIRLKRFQTMGGVGVGQTNTTMVTGYPTSTYPPPQQLQQYDPGYSAPYTPYTPQQPTAPTIEPTAMPPPSYDSVVK